MTGRDRRVLSSFLLTAYGFLKRYNVPTDLHSQAVAVVAYHLHAVGTGLAVPESNVTVLVRVQTDELRRDMRKLLKKGPQDVR